MLLIQVSLLAAKQDSQIAEKDNDELADDAFFSVVLDTAVVVEDITISSSGCRGGGTTGKSSFGVCTRVVLVVAVAATVVGGGTTTTTTTTTTANCSLYSVCSIGGCGEVAVIVVAVVVHGTTL